MLLFQPVALLAPVQILAPVVAARSASRCAKACQLTAEPPCCFLQTAADNTVWVPSVALTGVNLSVSTSTIYQFAETGGAATAIIVSAVMTL